MEQLINNETAVVISDLHVGDPEVNAETGKKGLDDFIADEEFERLLNEIVRSRAGWPTTLIINGDFIDFVQVLPEFGRHSVGDRFGVTEDRSRLKLQRVMEAHPRVFDALGKFLSDGGQALVLPGNHDIDFHWPGVFDDLRQKLGGVAEPQLRFVKEGKIEEQGLYIEHGNQYSYDNWFEFWNNPLRDAPDGRKRLERPWGTLFLDRVYNDFKDLYPFSNKVYPHWKLALVALRSYRDDENISAKAIARLALFFAGKGKRFLLEHLMGESKEDASGMLPIEDVLKRPGETMSEERLAEIKAETIELLKEDQQPAAVYEPPPQTGVKKRPGRMGYNDAWGMSKRQNELLESGETTIVAFGHTHEPVSDAPYGADDSRRVFNTGSWIPSVIIGSREKPYWRDLAKKSGIKDVRYLLIKIKPTPTAALEPVLAP